MGAVDLELARQFLRVTHERQDAVIQVLLSGAEAWVSAHLGVALESAARSDDLDGGGDFLLLRTRPATALASVTDLRTGAAEGARLAGDGLVWRSDAQGREQGRWPCGLARFRVAYTAGFGVLPPGLCQAILQLTHRAYERRGGEAAAGVAGATVSWEALAGGDIAALLRPFSRRRAVTLA